MLHWHQEMADNRQVYVEATTCFPLIVANTFAKDIGKKA